MINPQLIASDDANPGYVGARNPDDVLSATFYVQAVQDNFQTEKQARPIFKDEIFVRIMIPGRSDLTVEEIAREDHKQRFPRQWAIFQNKNSQEQINGTPVEQWPVLTRAQAEELKALRFYTVEQIADCSDAQITALGMNGNMLRQKARAFLASAQNSAAAQFQAVELAKRDEEIAALKAQMAQLMQQQGAPAAPAVPEKKAKKEKTPEERAAIGARLKAGRDKKKAEQAQQEPTP